MIFIKGLLIGFFLCAPFGPIGVFCVRITLLDGKIAGFLSVFGASVVDLIYCSIAGFGIAYLPEFIVREKILLEIFAGVVLMIVGIVLIRKRVNDNMPCKRHKTNLDAFSTTFFLTLAHPVPILVFTASFASFNISGWHTAPADTAVFVISTFIGSVLWAPLLVVVAGFFKQGFKLKYAGSIDLISGIIILVFGVFLGIDSIFRF